MLDVHTEEAMFGSVTVSKLVFSHAVNGGVSSAGESPCTLSR